MQTTFPKPINTGRFATYRTGDLADFAGVSPGDVLDMTYHLAHRWEHPDEQGSWREFADVVKWMRQAAHGIDAADIEIVIWQAGVEEIVEALGVEVRS